jgi:HdeA/HdeB family
MAGAVVCVHPEGNPMKSRLIIVALAAFVLPLSVNAQVMFDTTRVTCANYLAMSPTDARLFSAFMSGWFNQKTGHVTVDLNQYERNVANVRSWCGMNPNETVIAGLTRATGTVGK